MRRSGVALKESPKPEWPCLPRLIVGFIAVAVLLGGLLA